MKIGTLAGLFLGIGAASIAESATVTFEDYDVTINNGSVCHAINGGEAELLQRRATFLINTTSDTDIWTVCAFDRSELIEVVLLDGSVAWDGWSDDPFDNRFIRAEIDFSNTHDEAVSGVCVYREVAQNGAVVTTLVEPFTMSPGGAVSVDFGGPSQAPIKVTALNAVTIACLLPRNSRINRVVQAPYAEWIFDVAL